MTDERSVTAPPSDSGTPSIVNPSSPAWASSSAGALQAVSAASAAGRSCSLPKARKASCSICCSSVGVRSKRPVVVVEESRVPLPRFFTTVNERLAAPAARKPSRVAR